MTQIKDISTTSTTPAKTDLFVGQTAAGGAGSSFKTTYTTLRHSGRTTKTIYAARETTESGDQSANLLTAWNRALAVSGRVQFVVDPGTYALSSPRNLFQLRDNIEIVLDGVEFTVDAGVSTSGWDLSATDTYSYDNAIFYYATPAVSGIKVYGGLFTIGAEELSPFQIGDSLTHTTGSITNGNVKLVGLKQVGGNVIQVLSMDDVVLDAITQEGTHSSGLSFSNSSNVRVLNPRQKRIGVTADFATWNNTSAIVARGPTDVLIASPRIEYTGGTAILMRASSTKAMLRVVTEDAGISSAGSSGIEYQVTTDAAANSASEQLSIKGGYIKGYQCAPNDENHLGVSIAIAKTGGATIRGALVEGVNIDYVSPDETFSESTYTISSSYNTKKNVAATSVGTTNGIQLSGADADAVIYGGRIHGNSIQRAKGNSVLADHMAGGSVLGNVIEWGGWGRAGGTVIPLVSSHGIYVNVCAELDVASNTIRNQNPGSVGSGSVRSQLIRAANSYATHVHDNNLSGNDTTVAGSAWNYSPIGFEGSAFTLAGYTSRTCSIKVGRNNIFGTYFGLVGPDGSHIHRQGGSTGTILVYDDEFICTTTAVTQAIADGVTFVMASRTSNQAINLPDPTYCNGMTITVKHAGLAAMTVTVGTAAGTLHPAGPTLTTGQYGAWRANGTVWERTV